MNDPQAPSFSQISAEEDWDTLQTEDALSATTCDTDAGCRLDVFASQAFALTRSAAARLIADGHVTVDGKAASKRTSLYPEQTVTCILPPPENTEVLPENIPLTIIYEDSDLLVVDKPSGMVVHPAPGNPKGTLVNALLYHCRDSLSGIGGVMRPGIVHRIDKDTSGLLVVAKNDEAHQGLSAQLEGHHISREYRALVAGGFKNEEGTVDLPIGRHPTDRKRMAVIASGERKSRNAITHYRVMKGYGAISYLVLRLETGRTHQIRVHMSALGHPLLGDTVYGGGNSSFEKRHRSLLDGQCLHAAALTFCHPRTGQVMRFESPLPPNFERLLQILEAEHSSNIL